MTTNKKRRIKAKADFSLRIEKSVEQIRLGDMVKTASGREFQVIDVFRYEGRRVFKTDRFGLVYADELI